MTEFRDCATVAEVDEAVVESLAVFGDRQRCRILGLLAQGELCVNDLTQALGMRQNTLSHHLKVLREQGFLSARRKEGDQRWVYYRVNPERLHDLAHYFARMYADTQGESMQNS
jgi:DNA-binding transcriptional ArsR family regulator